MMNFKYIHYYFVWGGGGAFAPPNQYVASPLPDTCLSLRELGFSLTYIDNLTHKHVIITVTVPQTKLER
jgi:hypothetical protein